ncbi:hypothetical protein Y900_025460 [Mycolicibacterium aromaticivorans JS19b1 = JCM 16368]|uniref:Uncharacterized protein n=1 Tax=Mycolicibacterium aromaticivorans JS19b1 = JCM 16368 TaxID=1440774 RepID=A0A064CTP6_9MYCO|nr:hypothetical protein [Mycolicibacterium aromaticivorans]KDF02188.1 hypothetical protein Y900_025460 [Mycolicibacterium aromaticivorans JS19b1 = JCM 16368]
MAVIFALVLAVVGAVVLSAAGLQLWESRRRPAPRCAMPAPDGSRACADDAGHLGWHHTARARWFGAVWGPPAAQVRAAKPTAKPPALTAPAKIPTPAVAVLEPTPTCIGGKPILVQVGMLGTRRPKGYCYPDARPAGVNS